jgi:hypothetical protein
MRSFKSLHRSTVLLQVQHQFDVHEVLDGALLLSPCPLVVAFQTDEVGRRLFDGFLFVPFLDLFARDVLVKRPARQSSRGVLKVPTG